MNKPLLSDKPKRGLSVNPVILILGILILLPAGLFGGFSVKCKIDQYTTKRAHKDEIAAFENVKLASFDNSVAESYTGGDCVDSLPYVSLKKHTTFDRKAPEALADIKQTLSSQGFTLSDEKLIHKTGIKNADCGYEYKAQATSSKIDFNLYFFTYDQNGTRSAECASTGDKPATEAELVNAKGRLVSANKVIETLR